MATELNFSEAAAFQAFQTHALEDFPETAAYEVAAQPMEEVDINNVSQIRYWTERWDVSENALRKAVADVGTEVGELRIVLGR